MFDKSGAFARFASPSIQTQNADVYYVNSGQTKVIPVVSPSINNLVLTVGNKSIITTLAYKAPDGCIYGEVGDVVAIDLLPTAAGLQITNNEVSQLIINMWRV